MFAVLEHNPGVGGLKKRDFFSNVRYQSGWPVFTVESRLKAPKPCFGQSRKIRFALHEKKEAFVMFDKVCLTCFCSMERQNEWAESIFLRISKNVVGDNHDFLFCCYDFTSVSEQTYRGGARARAPRFLQNQNGPEGQWPAYEDVCSEPLWSRTPFFFTLQPSSITVPWVLFMLLTNNS